MDVAHYTSESIVSITAAVAHGENIDSKAESERGRYWRAFAVAHRSIERAQYSDNELVAVEPDEWNVDTTL